MELPSLVAFDLDNTLAESKQPLSATMAEALAELLALTRVAITSGGKLEQLDSQAAKQLPGGTPLDTLFLLPTSGAALFIADGAGGWRAVYEELLSPEELERARSAVLEGAKQAGVIDFSAPSYGERIQLRGAQVTLSALGQQAPVAEKKAWDPTHEKRAALRAAIAPLLPEFDVKVGGSTSIDVTKKGVNKAYGIRKLAAYLSLPVSSMLYIGDELGPGGNDEVVMETGIPTHAVKNPTDTEKFIRELVAQG